LKQVSNSDPALPIPSPPTNQAELAVQNEIYRKLLVKQILAWLRVGEWVVGGEFGVHLAANVRRAYK